MSMLSLVPGHMGGSEFAVRELLTGLAGRADVEPIAFVGAHAAGWTAGTGAEEVVLTRVRGGDSAVSRLKGLAVARMDRRTQNAVRASSEVVHYPFTVPVPSIAATPTVITLHDVQHLDLPAMFSRSELIFRRFAYDRAARRADAIVTVSEFSRSRILERLNVPADLVHVAPLGVSAVFAPAHETKRDPFVLYPARRWPHKNHRRLVSAMTIARRSVSGLRLVLTGGGPPLANAPDWVEQRGVVTTSELVSLYQRAMCVAFPSLYEGFGMPVLEAMACECPIAFARSGPLLELTGGHGKSFDPLDPVEMADAIIAASVTTKNEVEGARRRANEFTWTRHANVHVDIYKDLRR